MGWKVQRELRVRVRVTHGWTKRLEKKNQQTNSILIGWRIKKFFFLAFSYRA